MIEICFISRVPAGQQGSRHEVFLITKHGVEAKSYDNLGDAAKLKPMEVGVVKPVGVWLLAILHDHRAGRVEAAGGSQRIDREGLLTHAGARGGDARHEREHELPRVVLLHVQHVLPPRPRHLAGALPQEVLQVEETH